MHRDTTINERGLLTIKRDAVSYSLTIKGYRCIEKQEIQNILN